MQVDIDVRKKDDSGAMTIGPDFACKLALRKINGLEAALGDVKNVSYLLLMIPLFWKRGKPKDSVYFYVLTFYVAENEDIGRCNWRHQDGELIKRNLS